LSAGGAFADSRGPTMGPHDYDVDELAAQLDKVHASFGAHELVGFFVGLRSGPNVVDARTWVSALSQLGTATPPALGPDTGSDSWANARLWLGDVMDFLEHLEPRLAQAGPRSLCPEPSRTDDPTLGRWCQGYVRGARLHPEWVRDELADLFLSVLSIFSGDVAPETLFDPKASAMSLSTWRARHRARIPDYVEDLWEYWADAREALQDALRRTFRPD
jgi:hypothetical protein